MSELKINVVDDNYINEFFTEEFLDDFFIDTTLKKVEMMADVFVENYDISKEDAILIISQIISATADKTDDGKLSQLVKQNKLLQLLKQKVIEKEFKNVFNLFNMPKTKLTSEGKSIISKMKSTTFYKCWSKENFILLQYKKLDTLSIVSIPAAKNMSLPRYFTGLCCALHLFDDYQVKIHYANYETDLRFKMDNGEPDLTYVFSSSSTIIDKKMYDEAYVIRNAKTKTFDLYLMHFDNKLNEFNALYMSLILKKHKLIDCWFKDTLFFDKSKESVEEKQMRIADEKKEEKALLQAKQKAGQKAKKERDAIIASMYEIGGKPKSTPSSGGKSKQSTPSTGGKSKTATPASSSNAKKRSIDDVESSDDEEADIERLAKYAKKK
jgi:hypothetical protein